MTRILHTLVEIALLRAGPQALPASTLLTATTLAGYFALGIVLAPEQASPRQALYLALLDTLLTVALLQLALSIRGVAERMRQALSAVAGTGILLSLVVWPISEWASSAQRQDGAATPLAALALVALLAWYTAVLGHILRHALSTSFPAGLLLAVIYFVVSYTIVGGLAAG